MRRTTSVLVAAILIALIQTPNAWGLISCLGVGCGHGSGVPDLIYDATTGNMTIDADGSISGIGTLQLTSALGIFTGDPANLSPGLLTTDVDIEIGGVGFNPAPSIINLGNVAAPGLDRAFLLVDLFPTSISAGLGSPNIELELVYLGGGVEPPFGTDAAFSALVGDIVQHTFQATDDRDPPENLVWSDLVFNSSPAVPGIAASLSSDGTFSWNTTGSSLGEYSWTATVTDTDDLTGSATLQVTVVPEPTSAALMMLALGVGFCRCRLGYVTRH